MQALIFVSDILPGDIALKNLVVMLLGLASHAMEHKVRTTCLYSPFKLRPTAAYSTKWSCFSEMIIAARGQSLTDPCP